MTLDEAHPALVGFMYSAHAKGLRLVLVITGKGQREDPYDPMPRRRGVLQDAGAALAAHAAARADGAADLGGAHQARRRRRVLRLPSASPLSVRSGTGTPLRRSTSASPARIAPIAPAK